MTQPVIALHGAFVRQSSLDIEHMPFNFQDEGKVHYDAKVNFGPHRLVRDSLYAIRAEVELVLKWNEQQVGTGKFVMEMLMEAQGLEAAQLQHVLNVFGPNQLMPYLRQHVSMVTQASGYQQLTLPPVVVHETPPQASAETTLPAETKGKILNYGPRTVQ